MKSQWIVLASLAPLGLVASPVAAQSFVRPAGLTIPLEAASAGQGSFTGTLRILRFATQNNELVAVGLVSGTRADEAGQLVSVVRTVRLPARAGSSGAGTAAPLATPDGTSFDGTSSLPGATPPPAGTTSPSSSSRAARGTARTQASPLGASAATASTGSRPAGATRATRAQGTLAQVTPTPGTLDGALDTSCQPVHVEMGPLDLELPDAPLRVEQVLVDLDAGAVAGSNAVCSAVANASGMQTPQAVATVLNQLLEVLS